MKIVQDAASVRHDIEEFDKDWFGSSALFYCLYPSKLTLTGNLKLREKRAAWCWEKNGQRRRKGAAWEDSWCGQLDKWPAYWRDELHGEMSMC